MSKKKKQGSEFLVYLVVGLTSLALLLISVLIYKEHSTLGSFLKELSFAGVISLIVIFTVEKYSKERHRLESENLVKDINDNLFHAIYGRYIPNKVFREVERLLLNADVYRKNYSVLYSIENLEGDYSSYKCTAQSSYELENLTDESIVHNIGLALELPVFEEHLEHCKVQSVTVDNKQLSDSQIMEHSSVAQDQLVFSYPVEIRAGSKIRVDQVGTLIKLKTDQEIWTSRAPSDGFRLTVHAPEGVVVSAKSIHSKMAVEVQNTDSKKTWEITDGMIPNQGFIFWWGIEKNSDITKP